MDYGAVPLRQLQVWLDEDVCAVLDDYVRRPLFRAFASWPIRTLAPDAATPERGLVDELNAELKRCARAARRLTGGKTLNSRMAAQFPPRRVVTSESVEIGSGGERTQEVGFGQFDESELQLAQLSKMADEESPDLVNVNDYFEPQQEFVADESGRPVQRADWIVSLNPELLPVGNFIVRCLRKRLKTRVELLRAVIQKARSTLRQIRPTYAKLQQELDSSWSAVDRLQRELEALLRTGGDIQIVDACVAATQVYAAFHPAPDVGWLGLAPKSRKPDPEFMCARTRQLNNAEVFDRIATALGV